MCAASDRRPTLSYINFVFVRRQKANPLHWRLPRAHQHALRVPQRKRAEEPLEYDERDVVRLVRLQQLLQLGTNCRGTVDEGVTRGARLEIAEHEQEAVLRRRVELADLDFITAIVLVRGCYVSQVREDVGLEVCRSGL